MTDELSASERIIGGQKESHWRELADALERTHAGKQGITSELLEAAQVLRALPNFLARSPAGGTLDVRGFSSDISDSHILRVHFGHRVNDADRIAMLSAINALASPAPQITEAMVEAAHKALMGELFVICQPDKGNVFGFMDDHPEVLRAALTAAKLDAGRRDGT